MAEAIPLWQRQGTVGRILAVLGTVVTVAGLALMVVWARELGAEGPIVQLTIGTLMSVGLVIAGFLVHKKDAPNWGAPALVATGAAGAYLTVLAASLAFGYLPPLAALVIDIVLALALLVLAKQWRSQGLAAGVLALVLVLAPIVDPSSIWTAASLIATVVLSSLIALKEKWPALRAVESIGGALLLLVIPAPRASLFLIAIAFALANLAIAVAHRQLNPAMAQFSALMLIPPTLATLTVIPGRNDALDSALLAGLALTLLLPLAPPQTPDWRQISRVSAPLAALVGLVAGMPYLREPWHGFAMFGFAAVLFLLAWWRGSAPMIGGLIVAVIASLQWYSLAQRGSAFVLPILAPTLRAVALTVVGALTWALYPAVSGRVLQTEDLKPLTRKLLNSWPTQIARVAWLIFGSVAVLQVSMLVGDALGSLSQGLYVGHLVLTLGLLGLGAASLLLALRSAQPMERVYWGLALIAIAVLKLFTYDLSTQPGLVRVLAFLVTGVILLVLGTRYAKALGEHRALGERQA